MEDVLTIAIPVYNRSRFVREALESALHQTVPTKVIVVDNASTAFDFEPLVKEYQSPRLKFYRNPANLGAMGNWNQCIKHCTTPYLLILHDDDRLDLSYAELLQDILRSKPDIVVCQSRIMNENGQPINVMPHDMERYQRLENWVAFNPWVAGAVFSVERAREINGFKDYAVTSDFDFWFRMALRGRYHLVNKPMAWYRYYQSADRATTYFEGKYDMVPRLCVQIKRNRQALRAAYPEKAMEIPSHQYALSFAAFLKLQRRLSPWRARYLLAAFVRSSAQTLGGKTLRALFRHTGRPLCALIRAFAPAGKK